MTIPSLSRALHRPKAPVPAAEAQYPNISTCINDALPCEVLAHVFDFLQLDDVLFASQICAFWRATALGTPRLWAQLFDAPLSALPTLLARARAAPVSLDVIRITPTNFARVCNCIAQHLKQFAHLGLYFDHAVEFEAEDVNSDYRTWDWDLLWRALQHAAPRLRSFAITSDGGEFVTVLPGDLFASAPRLGRLTIDGFELAAPCAAFAGVEQFTGTVYALAPFQPLDAHFPALAELTMYDVSALPLPPLPRTPALRTLILHFVEMDWDWRDAVAWLRDSGVHRIPYVEVLHEALDVQRFVLQAARTAPRRLSIEDMGEGLVGLTLDYAGGLARVVPAVPLADAVAHVRACAGRVKTVFCASTPAALGVLAELDNETLAGLVALEIEVLPHTRRFLPAAMESVPILPAVKMLVLTAACMDLPAPMRAYAVDARDLLEFVRRIVPNVQSMQILGVPVSHVHELLGRFEFMYHQPPV